MFAMDVRSTKDKVLIDLEHRKELAKLLAAERSEELSFIERKQQLLAPPRETASLSSQPKTMLDIAQELNFWPSLHDYMRSKLLNKAGGMVKTEWITPLPDKVEQQSPYGNTNW